MGALAYSQKLSQPDTPVFASRSFLYENINDINIGDIQQVLKVTSTFCPNIKQLGGRFVDFPGLEKDLVRLIQAYPKGLKSLDVVVETSVSNAFVTALLKTSATTLEYLNLHALQCRIDPAVGIIRVLKEFPCLRKFSCGDSVSLNELLHTPWASHHLEKLEIRLVRPSDDWKAGDILMPGLIDDSQYPKLAAEILELHRKVKARSKSGFPLVFLGMDSRYPSTPPWN